MREKILAQLVTKYPGVSKKFLGLWADKLAAKVTEESQIEGALSELENLPVSIPDLATEFQKEGDRRVTEATKKPADKTDKADKADKGKDPSEDTDPQPDADMPKWAKTLLEQNKSLTERLSALDTEKRQTSIKDQIRQKLKDVPEKYWSKMALPAKEEDVESFTSEIAHDWAAMGVTVTDKTIPASGSGKTNASVDPLVVAHAKKQNEKVNSKN